MTNACIYSNHFHRFLPLDLVREVLVDPVRMAQDQLLATLAAMEDVRLVEVAEALCDLEQAVMEETAVGVSVFSLKDTAYEILRHT
jgi:hypothetical protein